MRGLGAEMMREFKGIGVRRVRLPRGMSVAEGIGRFLEDPNVEYVEPNYIMRASVDPDDPYFLSNDQWGMDRINAPSAWDIVNSAPDVVIAVIDSGVDYNHPDISNTVSSNLWSNAGETDCKDGFDDDSNDYVDDCMGWDFVGIDNAPMDAHPYGHGTHIAGVIGAVGDNSTGVAGVNWRVSIMPIRAMDSGGFINVADALKAIGYARAMGADVINCSWGGYGFSRALRDAVEATPALFVCAAGNGGEDQIGDDNDLLPHYPSGYRSANILSVAATDSSDVLAGFSNYGATTVDVGAPGVAILSAIPIRNTIWDDDFEDYGGVINSPWITDGENNEWGLDDSISNSSSYSLADSPGFSYPAYSDSWAVVNAPSLTGEYGCTVSYYIKYNFPDGRDFLCVEASKDDITYAILGGGCFTGSSEGYWERYEDDLLTSDNEPSVWVRFRLKSGAYFEGAGANIDDVAITCASTVYDGSEYGFMDGTSMAAPHAAGVAGLLKANDPTLTSAEMQYLIINTVVPHSSLITNTVSGGRIDAYEALQANTVTPPDAPSGLTAEAVSTYTVALSWLDNSGTEDIFTIERKRGGGAFVGMAWVLTNTTSYLDTGLSADTRYAYRVRAFNGKGSDYSNEVVVKTPDTGCFIATAAYGSPLAPEVEALRKFRDRRLVKSAMGRRLVELYYRHSPPLAAYIKERPVVRQAVRLALTPLLYGAGRPVAALAALMVFALAATLYLGGRCKMSLRERGRSSGDSPCRWPGLETPRGRENNYGNER